jgi:hypothetical protein
MNQGYPIKGDIMLRTKNITLSSEPTLLTTTDEVETHNTISVQNTDSEEYAWIGSESVTDSSFGIQLSPGQVWSADLGPYDKLYAVGAATISILILER